MFLGQYEHTLDEKGRMTIPARYRDLLEDGAFVTQGFDNNLMILPASLFEKLYQRVQTMSISDPVVRQLRRLIFSNADMVDFDKAGRIRIPQFLRQAAQLESATIVIGAGDYFEIWAADIWTQKSIELEDKETVAQKFSALDLSF